MDSFVFTRHSSDCKYKRDRLYRRCNCPKWAEGRFNGERVRKSASTRLWYEAEQFRQKLEETLTSGRPLSSPDSDLTRADDASPGAPVQSSLATVSAAILPASTQPKPAQSPHAPQGEILPPGRQKARVTIQKSVEVYMADARSRNLQTDTVKKLERLFEKQFLPWTKTEGRSTSTNSTTMPCSTTARPGPRAWRSRRRSRIGSSVSSGSVSAAASSLKTRRSRSARSDRNTSRPITSHGTSSTGSSMPSRSMAILVEGIRSINRAIARVQSTAWTASRKNPQQPTNVSTLPAAMMAGTVKVVAVPRAAAS